MSKRAAVKEPPQDKTYNGWTNYETWNVALWIGNEQHSEETTRGMAKDAYTKAVADSYQSREERAVGILAVGIKEAVEVNMPDMGASMFTDLLNAALSEVNWHEIAQHYIDEESQEAR
jgi:hypothetical protein